MNIAIDVRSLIEGRHSGVEEYTVQIICGMVRVAPQHAYHLFYNCARPVALPSLPDTAAVHAFRYPNKLLNLMQLGLGRPRWDVLMRSRYTVAALDVVFVPNFRLVPLSAGLPLVTVVHDLSFVHFPELFSARRRLWHRFMLLRSLLQRSHHIIAVSEATKRDVVAIYGVPPERVSVIYSGVYEVAQVPDEDRQKAVRSAYRLPERFILYLGRLEPRKNIPSIIQAFSAIAGDVPHDLVIAGEQGWLMDEIDRAYSTCSFRSRVHVIGFVEERDKAALYAAADLFVYPSLYEGFGFPPLEALLAGTPVITSFNSSLPEVVGDWATLVDPYDISELALVMKELLRTKKMISEEVRRAIRERYSWEKAARRTLAVLGGVSLKL